VTAIVAAVGHRTEMSKAAGNQLSPIPNKLVTAAGEKLRAKFRASNGQTRAKTEEHRRPESKTNQQDREPGEICKTSIPGSNPGGASNSKLLK
jgi:hypothetical protein